MKTSKKSVVLSSVQYIIIFIGFALSDMFTYPQYDVLLFTREFIILPQRFFSRLFS